MARLFNSYIIVDWSASSKPATGKDSIWIGAYVPDARLRLTFRASNPETRAKALEQLKDLIDRLTHRGDRILLGFDFPLGFPKGASAALNLKGDTPRQAMADFLSKELKDKPDNSNNRFALAARMNRIISEGPFPFWGCPKRDALTTLSIKKAREHGPEDIPEYRLSEKAAIKSKKGKPQPVWKIAYAGAVGGQSMTGIPVVEKLRQDFPSMKLWPFDLPLAPLSDDDLENVSVVACEVYPSMLPADVKTTEYRDESQVRVMAEHFAKLDESGDLARLFQASADLTEDDKSAISGEEGWILGV